MLVPGAGRLAATQVRASDGGRGGGRLEGLRRRWPAYVMHHLSPVLQIVRTGSKCRPFPRVLCYQRLKVTYRREGDDFQLRFSHRFESEEEALFAFAIPFSYAQNCELLDHLDALMQPYTVMPPPYELDPAKDPSTAPQPPGVPSAASRFTPRTPSPAMSASGGTGPVASRRVPAASIARGTAAGVGSPAAAVARRNSGISSDTGAPALGAAAGGGGGGGASFSGGAGSSAPSYTSDEGPSRLYYRRQLLTRSLEGRRIEVITITDCAGAAGAGGGELEPPLPGVFEHDPGPPAATFSPEHKKVFFVSSRVHPGETPATHMFNGLLAFLLRRTDPRAAALRRRFVFKLVPIVNVRGGCWVGGWQA